MKNKTLIFWLIIFFPIGLYYIFNRSNWSAIYKYGVALFYALICSIVLLSGDPYPFLFLNSLTLFGGSLIILARDLYKQNGKRRGLTHLALATVLLVGTGINLETPERTEDTLGTYETADDENEEEESEDEEAAALAELEDAIQLAEEAVEKAEDELTRSDLENAQQLVADLPEDLEEFTLLIERLEFVEAQIVVQEEIDTAYEKVELAEEDLTRERYDSAVKAVEKLDEPIEELEERLTFVLADIEEIETNIEAATQAIETAEAEPTWSNHETASSLIAVLPSSQSNTFTSRLNTVEKEIVTIEEQKAQEAKAEAERQAEIASQQAEEAARAAEAEEKQRAEEQAQAASQTEQVPQNNSATGEEALLNFLNTASYSDLQTVSYIGPKRATYIIEYRQANGNFTHSNQVTNVNQIGDGIYGNLRAKFNMD